MPAAETPLSVETAVRTNDTPLTQSRPHLKARAASPWAQDYRHLRPAAEPSHRRGYFPYRYVARTCGAPYRRHGHPLPLRMRTLSRLAVFRARRKWLRTSLTPLTQSVGVARARSGGRRWLKTVLRRRGGGGRSHAPVLRGQGGGRRLRWREGGPGRVSAAVGLCAPGSASGERAPRRLAACRPAGAEGKSPRQCLKEGHCRALQYSFFECKRSMLDTRSRFRGRKGY
ncbi:Cytochrome c oxidase assembly factor 5 [Lemmus lemmus]